MTGLGSGVSFKASEACNESPSFSKISTTAGTVVCNALSLSAQQIFRCHPDADPLRYQSLLAVMGVPLQGLVSQLLVLGSRYNSNFKLSVLCPCFVRFSNIRVSCYSEISPILWCNTVACTYVS